MEERSEEPLAFSVRVFTLQEEMTAEETHMDTHEEVRKEVADVLQVNCLFLVLL